MSDYIKQLQEVKDWWYAEKDRRYQYTQELKGQKRDLNQRMDQLSQSITSFEQSIAREERIARETKGDRRMRSGTNRIVGDYKRAIREAKTERRNLASQRRDLDGSIRDWQTSFEEAKSEFKQAKQNYETALFGTGLAGGGSTSTHPIHGLTADCQPVTFSEGTKNGHIYLRDGHAENRDGFWGPNRQEEHDHYNNQGGGTQRGKYTGEGS